MSSIIPLLMIANRKWSNEEIKKAKKFGLICGISIVLLSSFFFFFAPYTYIKIGAGVCVVIGLLMIGLYTFLFKT